MIKNNKILVCKNENVIMISQNGKKFIINNEDILFNQLKDLTKEEIIKWYLSR